MELKVDVDISALAPLGLTDANADTTQDVWFYDTATLALYDGGLILRARKVHGGTDDTTVKARPMDVAQVAPAWLAQPGAKCEVDATIDAASSACSLTEDAAKGQIDAVGSGAAIATLYTADQLVFVGSIDPAIDFSSLLRLGPISSTVWKATPSGLPAPVSIERWVLPASSLLEVSTRIPHAQAADAQTALLGWLAAQGVTPSADQDSKTRQALAALVPP